jgi:hypothetical protein
MFHDSHVLEVFFYFNRYNSRVHYNSIVIAFFVNKNLIQLSEPHLSQVNSDNRGPTVYTH